MLATSLVGAGAADGTALNVTFCCAPDNDFYRAVRDAGYRCQRYVRMADAIGKAQPGSGVLLLADGYPDHRLQVETDLFEAAARKHLRLYVEYPEAVPGMETAAVRGTHWERVVVSSEVFGSALPRHRILMVPDCRYVPMRATAPWLSLARVAGFDTAVYGLPADAQPLLFEAPGRDLLIATTRLSGGRRGRYAPTADWGVVWGRILAWLDPHAAPVELRVKPEVHPAYAAEASLPADAERCAFQASVRWYRRSGLLLSPEGRAAIDAPLRAGQASAPLPATVPSGDGSLGVLEGYASDIRVDGRQDPLISLRADCWAETAMVFALDGAIDRQRGSADIARRLLEATFTVMQSGVRGDPHHPAYGLISWGAVVPAWEVANYGDDNARTLLSALIAAASLGEERWDAAMLRALLANLRTTGRLGFRGDRIDIPALEANGWRHYADASPTNYAPHFESYLWACYLWAYRQTGESLFLERAKTAIRMTMAVYPAQWRWKDSIERARMLLCLAWLVRVEDTPEHRGWLHAVTRDLLAVQAPCGAIREVFAGAGGHFQAPASNDAYGVGEAPLAQRDGDPVTDQLYTSGFALLGLHEAVAATGDPALKSAEDRLAAYLCRIQVRAPRLAFLDGAWLRAFDYRRWDYWASGADVGWGPWNAESGWGPAWTSALLALRLKGTNVWDLTAKSRIARHLDKAQQEMAINTGGPWSRR